MPRSGTHNRWVTPREALACQAIPVLKQYSYGIATCTWANENFDTDNFEYESRASWKAVSPDLQRTSRIGQAGNAMHAECVGVAISWVLIHGVASRCESTGCGFGPMNAAPTATTPEMHEVADDHADDADAAKLRATCNRAAPQAQKKASSSSLLSNTLSSMARMIAGGARRSQGSTDSAIQQ